MGLRNVKEETSFTISLQFLFIKYLKGHIFILNDFSWL